MQLMIQLSIQFKTVLSCGHVKKKDGFFLLDSSYATEKPTSDPKFACVRQLWKKRSGEYSNQVVNTI